MMYPPIFALVAADATATGLLGTTPTRFWPFSHAPQNEERPYALHTLVYGLPENTLSCPPDIDTYGVQVDCYAKDVTAARNVAEAIRDAVEGDCYLAAYNGEEWEQATGLYRVGMTFDFWMNRT